MKGTVTTQRNGIIYQIINACKEIHSEHGYCKETCVIYDVCPFTEVPYKWDVEMMEKLIGAKLSGMNPPEDER